MSQKMNSDSLQLASFLYLDLWITSEADPVKGLRLMALTNAYERRHEKDS